MSIPTYSFYKHVYFCFLLTLELLAVTTMVGTLLHFQLKIQFQAILDMEMTTWGANLSFTQA